jgi:two-component system cell cycle sensor histidine kinase/response regulator CckA
MREVTNSSAVFIRDACGREGISFDELTRGMTGLERIDESGRIDWDVFAELLERFAERTSLETLERAGERTVDDAFADSIRVIAGALASSRVLYRAIVRWFAPAAVHALRLAYFDRSDGTVQITIDVPHPHRPSIPFFYLTLGSYRAAPRLLGQPDALVEMIVSDRRVVYTIVPPPDLTLWTRALRAVKIALGARRAIEELSEQQEQLRLNYRALLDSRRDFRHVIDSVPNGVLIHRGGAIAYANPCFSKTLGVDLTGKRVEDLVHPDSRAQISEMITADDSSSVARPVEIAFVRANGETATLEVFPSENVDFEGKPSRVLVAHDVTERKELQAKAQLAERMASIGTIAAGVAHEINNPLTYVIANVRRMHAMLSAADGTDPSGELVKMAADALNGVERVEVIVRDLKMFSRADTDVVMPIDVRAVLESTARIAESELRQRARLVKDFNDVPYTVGNAARLGQVFLNLLVNAAHSIPEGNVEGNEIRISTRNTTDRVVVEVSDTGSGISKENLPRVFQAFFTTKPIGVGTGLGLAICHNIVTSMGGEITVTSEVGVGTTVSVHLPISAAPAPRPRSVRPSIPSRSGPKRILVVDDEPLVARALERTLRGNDVTVVLSGKDALAALSGEPFDLVFCDLMMPGVSGMDLYQELRPDQQERFVFVTGGAFTARAQTFLASIPNRTIDKPLDTKLVKKIVAELDAPPPPSENGRP